MKSLIKRYFLAFAKANGGPFLAGGIWGLAWGFVVFLGMLTISSSRRLDPPVEPLSFLVPGLGLVSAILHDVVCRLFISYKKESGPYLVVEDDRVIVAGSPLWTGLRWLRDRKGIRVLWVGLPSTRKEQTIRLGLAGGAFSVGLIIFFTEVFDPQEIYEKFARRYTHFDHWLRDRFLSVVKDSADVLRVLDDKRPPEARLVELMVVLERVLRHAGFPKALENIDRIEVVVSVKREFTLV